MTAWTAKVPAASAAASAAIAALDEAAGKTAVELAVWVANVLQGAPTEAVVGLACFGRGRRGPPTMLTPIG